MKKMQFWLAIAASMILMACSSEPMSIVTGKDFIQKRAVIVDTTSTFHSSDQFIMQFRYGKNFDFSKIKWEVSTADGKTISSKTSPVNAKEGSYTIIVSSVRKGGIANAAEFFKAKEGTFRIRFSNADADSLLLEKQVRVVLNSEKIDGE